MKHRPNICRFYKKATESQSASNQLNFLVTSLENSCPNDGSDDGSLSSHLIVMSPSHLKWCENLHHVWCFGTNQRPSCVTVTLVLLLASVQCTVMVITHVLHVRHWLQNVARTDNGEICLKKLKKSLTICQVMRNLATEIY